jgi:uncharacterized protein YodC (DUF2158 family)
LSLATHAGKLFVELAYKEAGMTFKIGDIVVLKSGGPKMTVISDEDTYHRVYCAWFAGAKSERAHYPLDALESPKEQPKK